MPGDHNINAADVYHMVLNRLRALQDTPTNETLISAFTLEVMYALEKCLMVSRYDYITSQPDVIDLSPAIDIARVGVESNYTVIMRMIIADLIAVRLLLDENIAMLYTQSSRAIKKAKAGPVEVEYENTSSGRAGNIGQMMDRFQKSAANLLALNFNCVLGYCGDGCISVEMVESILLPFKVVKDKN